MLVDLGKGPIVYQGLALATQRSYLRQRPQIIDSIMRGVLESVAFIQKPSQKEVFMKSLAKNLRLKSVQEAQTAYQPLQWLYNLDIDPILKGIQNMHRCLSCQIPR